MATREKNPTYRKVEPRMWGDAKIMALSRPPPCGQALWFHLLTGEQTDIIPGLFKIGEAAFAEALGWNLEGFRHAFAEISTQGLAHADWKARVVFVPTAIRHNVPQSVNVVKRWRGAWERIPECSLKLEAWHTLKAFLDGMSKGYREAFDKACPKPCAIQEAVNREQEAVGKAASAQVREGDFSAPQPEPAAPPAAPPATAAGEGPEPGRAGNLDPPRALDTIAELRRLLALELVVTGSKPFPLAVAERAAVFRGALEAYGVEYVAAACAAHARRIGKVPDKLDWFEKFVAELPPPPRPPGTNPKPWDDDYNEPGAWNSWAEWNNRDAVRDAQGAA